MKIDGDDFKYFTNNPFFPRNYFRLYSSSFFHIASTYKNQEKREYRQTVEHCTIYHESVAAVKQRRMINDYTNQKYLL